MASRLKLNNLETLDGTFNINVVDLASKQYVDSKSSEKGGIAWDSSLAYVKGDLVVTDDGTIYTAVLPSTNNPPSVVNPAWTTFMDAGTY